MSVSQPYSILLVEDDHDDIDLFTYVLGTITKEVLLTIASDGSTAIKVLTTEECQPNCIFLDLKLPLMDGLEVLHSIRKTPALASLPVIVLSSVDNPLIRKKCVELGIENFVSKSADTRTLAATLRNCMT